MATRQRKTRLPAPLGAEHAEGHCGAEGDRQVVLVLQGDGALGAYQAWVYEALHEAGIEPDWVIGTSIGAINAALIVGNARAHRVERLRDFWHTASHKGLPGLPTAWTALRSRPSSTTTRAAIPWSSRCSCGHPRALRRATCGR